MMLDYKKEISYGCATAFTCIGATQMQGKSLPDTKNTPANHQYDWEKPIDVILLFSRRME